MNRSRSFFCLALLCGSGILTFVITSKEEKPRDPGQGSISNLERPAPRPSRRSELTTPLPLDKRKVEKMDPTNYEVSVSDLALREKGEKIERESRQRLRELTNRYQLTANQRREAFPLLVSYHADFTPGLIVNGFEARPPKADNLASELYLILDLTQQEAYQEDVLADSEWWSEIIGQLRADLDRSLFSKDPGESRPPIPGKIKVAPGDGGKVKRPDFDLNEVPGN